MPLKKQLVVGTVLFAVPGYTHGYQKATIESICGGSDNSVPAKCFLNGSQADVLPLAYGRAHAVARLALPESFYCTGFLIGSEGHLLTTGTCIASAEDAAHADYEFGAESASCADECKIQAGCKGTIVRTSAEFITSSSSPDYALVKLAAGPDLAPYGYLQVRGNSAGAAAGESVYVPGHPNIWPKRIAAYTDGINPATIVGLGVVDVCGEKSMAYNADTQGGSAGSPLVAWSDNLLVGMHTCGGCTSGGGTNGAADMRDILADLAAKNIEIKDVVYSPPTSPPPTTTAPPPTTTAPPPPPTTTAPPPTITTAPPPTTTAPPPTTTAPPPTTTVPPPALTTRAPHCP